MSKKLVNLTWEELQPELSMGGNPEKMSKLGKRIFALICKEIDTKNAGELINIEIVLQKLQAEIRMWKRIYEKRTGQKFA